MDITSDRKSELAEAIARTIVFFDLFEYPLTSHELWQYLPLRAELTEVISVLDGGLKNISSSNGMYFITTRESIVLERQKKYNYSREKMKKAEKIARVFRFFKIVEMVAVSNIIGANNLRDGSDIDLFIVSKPNRLWLARLFCVLVVKILGRRPNKKTKRNRFCLSFYVSSQSLDLKELKLGSDDWYFNYWLAGLVPVYDPKGIYSRLMIVNSWLKDYLPNWQPLQNRPGTLVKKIWQERGLSIGLGNIFEKMAKRMELRIMPKGLKDLMNVDTRVIVSDEMIKLYLVDRRREFIDKYSERFKQYFSI
jgi:hypothetical protein